MIPTLPTLRKVMTRRVCLLSTGFSLCSGSFFSQVLSLLPVFVLTGGIVCFVQTNYSMAAVQMQTGNSSVLQSPSPESPVFEDTNGTITIRTPTQPVPHEVYPPENYSVEPKIILPYGVLPPPQGTSKNYGKAP